MNKHKILLLLIPMVLIIFLLIILIFTINFNYYFSSMLYADDNSLTITFNQKSYDYIKNINSKYYEYILNPISNQYEKCFFIYQTKKDDMYYYYCNLSSSSEFTDGIYYSTIKLRNIHIYEYLLYFH